MSLLRRPLALFALLFFCGCGDGSIPAPSGLDEPVRIRGRLPDQSLVSQLVRAPLPQPSGGPAVIEASLTTGSNRLVYPGQSGKKLQGNVEASATSVAIQVRGLGSGYWVVPVGSEDVFNPALSGTYTFQAVADFAADVAPGPYSVDFVGIDEQGRAGPAASAEIDMQPVIPDGQLVVSLSWDVNADLDLHLITPEGKDINPKAPTSALEPSLLDASAPLPSDVGFIDRDSNAACVIDSLRRESVVWASDPPPGEYDAKVDMFNACGQPGASFQLGVYQSGVESLAQAGRLLAINADDGTGPFLLIAKFIIPPK